MIVHGEGRRYVVSALTGYSGKRLQSTPSYTVLDSLNCYREYASFSSRSSAGKNNTANRERRALALCDELNAWHEQELAAAGGGVGFAAAGVNCERCGTPFVRPARQPNKRFCSRRCQMNAYSLMRRRTDPVFHAAALEYQRLWRVRERARASFGASGSRSPGGPLPATPRRGPAPPKATP